MNGPGPSRKTVLTERLRFNEANGYRITKEGDRRSTCHHAFSAGSRNADEQRLTEGPPNRSARDIANSVEPYFEILPLVSSHSRVVFTF
jgi:hypothetical protein